MKKWSFNSFLIICLVFILVACGKTDNAQKEQASKEKEQPSTEQSATTEVEKAEKITIQAPAGISIAAPLYKIMKDNSLLEGAEEVEFLTWNTPDELRARISGKQVQISAVPTYVGANLYNKGVDIQLVNTLIWGILYFIGPEGETISWESLKGKTVHVPFKGDMPALVFQYLLQKNGLDIEKDLKVEYSSTPQEVVQLLAAGKAQYAVLPEHTASLVMAKAKKEGVALQKSMSLQEEWAKATGKEPRIPQAGIIVDRALIQEHPEFVELLQKQIETSIQFLKNEPVAAGELLASYQEGLEPAFITKLLPYLNIEFVTAQEAKEELEFFFEQLASLSPEIIGGQLPDEKFYYEP
ncbi:ABC transporter substrate-binding protein [Lysinibacillus sp. NPDC047702]|uniref:ABC transporter substrate-binding protein n=1 Tax=unclassified Lysinibacillus TaxID=2636778 RepID=UPI003D050CC6